MENNDRSKKVLRNVIVEVAYQVIALISAFVLPRLILSHFGSVYNGIITSITQFLGFIELLRGGVGGVTRAALYKPLSEKNYKKISEIIVATDKYLRRVLVVFVCYIFVLMIVYPFFVEGISRIEIVSLIIILSISTLVQYYASISYQLLLCADMKQYVINCINLFSVLISTIVASILILLGNNIFVVKAVSAIIYCIGPIFLHFYVRNKYCINRKAEADVDSIKDKWDAFAQQVANYIHNNTDVVVLTVFSGDIRAVSIYGIYNMAVNGAKKVISLCTSGIEAAFGNMIAKKEDDLLVYNFKFVDYMLTNIVLVVFTMVATIVTPFVLVYTKGIDDASIYNQSIFGYIIVLAEFLYCLRLPYQMLVNAYGHYKQTKLAAILEAVINLSISFLLVGLFRGTIWAVLLGVASGTLLANLFRLIHYIKYSVKNLIKLDFGYYSHNIVRNLLFIICTIVPMRFVIDKFEILDLVQWVAVSGLLLVWDLFVLVIVNLIFDKESFLKAMHRFGKIISRK